MAECIKHEDDVAELVEAIAVVAVHVDSTKVLKLQLRQALDRLIDARIRRALANAIREE